MNTNVYSIEILYSGKYESWEFASREKRDSFYEKVIHEFNDQKVNKQDDEVDDTKIVQLSSNNLELQEDGEYAQNMTIEWFDYDIFSKMLDFINHEFD
ncbi:hypothetical protein GPDM_08415 [Planococcus donghaensis MPA1U2]|uniref:Uncharacterized protein n=1 Tax=Planococcus donghaensis MPA1U2 TaxID=933115 RepID=E7RGT5_9BACL|nr:hypothetical protein [Planococcus donghaensis]EGA89818.1 hypothetical protein GPDM_08415 [Planococcus donghaensis MPA1U2]